jgi:2-alkenal reductase
MRKSLSVSFIIALLAAVLLTGCGTVDELSSVLPDLNDTAETVVTEVVDPVALEQVNNPAQVDPTSVQVNPDPTVPAVLPGVPAQIVDYQQQLIGLYARVNPAVVSVNLQTGGGSGFVITADGNIVTNNHVVEAGGPIVIAFANGDRYDAEVLGTDPQADIALLDIEANNLPTVPLGDSDALQVGQLVVAIGSPFGLDNTMTTGIVSGLSRSLPGEGFTGAPSYQVPNVIQTDAAINPGNSGGPLLTLNGEVVGVNTAIESPVRANSGVGFAVPSNVVSVVVEQLRSGGRVAYPWLGIQGGTMTSDIAEEIGLSRETRGVIVSAVTPGGPAEASGLLGGDPATGLGGDVIVGIDNQPVNEFDDLLSYVVQQARVGQTVRLSILRDGQPMTIDLVLGERPAEIEPPASEN